MTAAHDLDTSSYNDAEIALKYGSNARASLDFISDSSPQQICGYASAKAVGCL